MVFPKHQIDEIKKQEGRDLTRFDLDFDLPDAPAARVSRRPSSSPRAPTWATCRKGKWSRCKTTSSCSTAS